MKGGSLWQRKSLCLKVRSMPKFENVSLDQKFCPMTPTIVRVSQTQLSIYQLNEVLVENPDPADIQFIMERIIMFDKRINELKE